MNLCYIHTFNQRLGRMGGEYGVVLVLAPFRTVAGPECQPAEGADLPVLAEAPPEQTGKYSALSLRIQLLRRHLGIGAVSESLAAGVCCTHYSTGEIVLAMQGLRAERGNKDQAMPRNGRKRIDDKDMTGSLKEGICPHNEHGNIPPPSYVVEGDCHDKESNLDLFPK